MSWEQLRTILRTNREDRRQDMSEPPVSCPIDGELLEVRGDGIRNCPMGNFRWP